MVQFGRWCDSFSSAPILWYSTLFKPMRARVISEFYYKISWQYPCVKCKIKQFHLDPLFFCFHSFTQDVVARIKLPTANFMVQCHKELSGCGGGGWTPVMKIDGSKVWFTFSSWETLICTLIHIHLINTLLPNRLTFKYMFCNFKNKPHFSSLVNLRSFGIYRLGWDRTGDHTVFWGNGKG